jgi:carboxylesterase type B
MLPQICLFLCGFMEAPLTLGITALNLVCSVSALNKHIVDYLFSDGNFLVKRSLEIGRPIIIVTINYRLNVFGFLSSRELIEEARGLGEKPISNQGLNDQRIALQWIQSSIHHFGGDASRITLAGESAGAASVLCHLTGGLPLFQQALLQSPPAPRLRTPQEAQTDFDDLVEHAGIPSHASGTEKLAALRDLTSEQLVEIFDGRLSFPIEDSHWFLGYDRNNQDQSTFWGDIPTWCSRIVFGNTRDEAALLLALSTDLPTREVVEFSCAIVPHIPIPDKIFKEECTRQELVAWSTKEAFINPLLKVVSSAASKGSRVYIYRIDSTDPFPGPLQGFAWHSFGIPLTFYQPPCRVYPELASTQDHMSVAFLDFFHGLKPWEEFNQAQRMIVFKDKSTTMVTIDAAAVKERKKSD